MIFFFRSRVLLREELLALHSANKLGIGLHLNLTEGAPLCAASDVPTLVGKDGLFIGKLALLDSPLPFSEADIEREARAQFERLTGEHQFFHEQQLVFQS